MNQSHPVDEREIDSAHRPDDFDLMIGPGMALRTYWRDIWRYRGLLFFLSWRDILVLYKQTAIGVAWALIRPLLTMLILTIVFGRLANLPSQGVRYPILVFAAMIPWQMFAGALQESSNSLLANANLISKVYFPRILVPASAVAVSLVDFAISLVILLLLMLWYRVFPTWRLLTLPLFAILGLTLALGVGTWFSAFNVKYRDFRYVVPFVVQFGIYASPVGFSSSVIPAAWRPFYSLNPMVGVIDGFRWAITGGITDFDSLTVVISVALSVLIFITGVLHFRTVERTFADVI